MPRYARTTKRTFRKSGYRRKYAKTNKRAIARVNRRVSAISRRLAAETCKFESTPDMYSNTVITGIPYPASGTTQFYYISGAQQLPLTTITSGTPWIMPLNWIYQGTSFDQSASNITYDGVNTNPITQNPTGLVLSCRNPLWYNTYSTETISSPTSESTIEGMRSPGFQYRLKYLYIRGLFNASVSNSVNNTDGAVRIVIVKDKQASGGAATWYDENEQSNSRGVFNAQRIDAQLNPNTIGRFKILYDKTLRFNTINGYKPFKYFKRISSIVKNNRDLVSITSGPQGNGGFYETSSRPPPVQRNAFYLMIFSDGLTFNYSDDSATPAASFHIFNRVSYYDN